MVSQTLLRRGPCASLVHACAHEHVPAALRFALRCDVRSALERSSIASPQSAAGGCVASCLLCNRFCFRMKGFFFVAAAPTTAPASASA
jgi:hypothetical protein